MKKKILALCLVVVLAITAVTGATLAYFTDTDVETNTFTVGNVEIDLVEEYQQKSQLLPDKKIDKKAYIKNTGVNDAYVFAEVLIPKILDDGIVNEPEAPGLQNSLHFNYPGMYSVEYAQNTNEDEKYYNEEMSKLWVHKYEDAANNIEYGYLGVEEIGNVEYNKYVKLYTEKLAPNDETSLFMNTVYMDKLVEQCSKDGCTCNGKGYILYDRETCYNANWDIIVRAYAIQAEGFEDTVDEATGNITEYGYVKAYKAFDGNRPAIDREQNPDEGPTA